MKPLAVAADAVTLWGLHLRHTSLGAFSAILLSDFDDGAREHASLCHSEAIQ
jgi:hypothetical protein